VLTLLNISNIALIDELRVEFEPGLNLLTGETGSGKSIIVDALGVLIGGRFVTELLKTGTELGFIEGLFTVTQNSELRKILESAGIELDENSTSEIIIRRELSTAGRNKIFINNHLATQTLLRELRPYLVDIHGQGDQQTLFDATTHLELLDAFAGAGVLRQEVAEAYRRWNILQRELGELRRGEAEKFQMVDILKFQIEEIARAQPAIAEDEQLEEERRQMQNTEKLTTLCAESYSLIYEDHDAALARVRQTTNRIEELAEYNSSFREYLEGLESVRAILEDLAFALRDFSERLEYSPERLATIGTRLADITRLKRKYGGTIESVLEHLARSEDQLQRVEHSEEREQKLTAELAEARSDYLAKAARLHRERVQAAKKFERAVERDLAEVAMESARFQIQIASTIETPDEQPERDNSPGFTERGTDVVEFYFSANVGEAAKPLARIASGGEASRLMLVLKTVANALEFPRTIVFDEIDTGIGGRVSEAVGAKLKKLSESNQVLCVTHQPQIARFADNHLVVHKEVADRRTIVTVERLDRRGRVEELARMLTGAEITESARRHARELLKT